jgi:hypothetical protein
MVHTVKGQGAGQTCGASLESHIMAVQVGLVMAGAGGGCEDVYRALLEVAEGLKRYFGYSDYTPSGDVTFNQLDQEPINVPPNASIN